MRFRWRDRGEVIVSVHYYQIFGFTIRKSLSVELKLLIKIISSFDNNRKCYTLNRHQILSYDSYSSTLWFILFFFFFINGFNHRYKNLSLDASIYVTLHVSVCISVNKLVQIYCETPRKKNRWIFAIPLLWIVR